MRKQVHSNQLVIWGKSYGPISQNRGVEMMDYGKCYAGM